MITGGGKVGEYLATDLLRSRHQVAIIEQNSEKVEHLALILDDRALVVHGDGCDSNYLSDAGIAQADIFVATTGADDTNLVACELARKIFQVPRCIARVNYPKNLRIFQTLGIEAVSSTSVISRMIEREATEGSKHSVMTLLGGDLRITEITAPGAENDGHPSGLAEGWGILISSIKMPEDSTIVAISHGGQSEIVNPQSKLHCGDTVVCISRRGMEEKILSVLKSSLRSSH
ncbi:MAG: NAD-binding protein [Coriobacteriales bacterium]|nr:NAD-binding protein [Coriobacteriales bacterium]